MVGIVSLAFDGQRAAFLVFVNELRNVKHFVVVDSSRTFQVW